MKCAGPAMLLLAACGDFSAEGDDWVRLDVPAADGVTFDDVSVVGDATFAVGTRGESGAVLRIDGDAWASIETPDMPPLGAVYAADPQDVWVATRGGVGADPVDGAPLLLRWDGAVWSPVDLGIDARSVGDVWGTSSEDVWLTARLDQEDRQSVLLHWDGAALTAAEDLHEITGEHPTEQLITTSGCSRARGDVSLIVNTWDLELLAGWSLWLDEGTWRTRPVPLAAYDLECDGERRWATGGAFPPSVSGVLLDDGTGWRTVVTSPDDVYSGIDMAAGEVWVRGRVASGDDGEDRGAIWRYREGRGLSLSASAPIGPDGSRPFRAVYETPSGEVRALGEDGLVLALRPSP